MGTSSRSSSWRTTPLSSKSSAPASTRLECHCASPSRFSPLTAISSSSTSEKCQILNTFWPTKPNSLARPNRPTRPNRLASQSETQNKLQTSRTTPPHIVCRAFRGAANDSNNKELPLQQVGHGREGRQHCG